MPTAAWSIDRGSTAAWESSARPGVRTPFGLVDYSTRAQGSGPARCIRVVLAGERGQNSQQFLRVLHHGAREGERGEAVMLDRVPERYDGAWLDLVG
jgi:hypothetical protein